MSQKVVEEKENQEKGNVVEPRKENQEKGNDVQKEERINLIILSKFREKNIKNRI